MMDSIAEVKRCNCVLSCKMFGIWFLQDRNVHGMKLVEGEGNAYDGGKPVEGDRFNTVYILVRSLPLLDQDSL